LSHTPHKNQNAELDDAASAKALPLFRHPALYNYFDHALSFRGCRLMIRFPTVEGYQSVPKAFAFKKL